MSEQKGFCYFSPKGIFTVVESPETAARNAKRYLSLPAGFRVEGGDAWDRDTRIGGELPYEETSPKDRTPGIVTWDVDQIQGNITQYPALMAVARELLA